jgi:small subunit ribosomal protein S9
MAEEKIKKAKAVPAKKEKYFEGIGRRKSSIARVRIFLGGKGIEINGKSPEEYFNLSSLRKKVLSPVEKAGISESVGMTIKVYGGGITGQADAIRLGISRALVESDEELRKKLRRVGYLTRDSRRVERKKYGLKKARRAPQWRKR